MRTHESSARFCCWLHRLFRVGVDRNRDDRTGAEMNKPSLTVERLRSGGFEEVGCWELNNAQDLAHSIDLPNQAGVYAFVIDGVVQYVGLASNSLRQRLGFYRKPGVSQRTNLRLNEIIRGHLREKAIVQIFIARPADHDWNGFKVNGSEGLEAGLIAEFDLPWNMRGSVRQLVKPAKESSNQHRQRDVSQQILDLIKRRPGMTELEIAKAIYGPTALQPQVNAVCRKLIAAGLIMRRGQGRSDPFIYHAVD
jgi:hypothetical protein